MKTLANTSQALIVSLVMVVASAGAAWAQPGPGFVGGPGMMGEGPGMMRGDPQERWELMQQRHAQRMQDLEKQLNLRSEQQAAWKAFLEAHNAWLQSMHAGWQSGSGAKTTPERFDMMAKLMEQRLPSVQDLAKKAHGLYDILDVQQRAMTRLRIGMALPAARCEGRARLHNRRLGTANGNHLPASPSL